jgi:hypothetical protein
MQRQPGAKPPAFLSSHPTDEQRQQRLRTRLEELERKTYVALDLGDWPPSFD